jgi:hypothetical protein
MGKQVTLNTVREACTTAAQQKVLEDVYDAEMNIAGLQKRSVSKLPVTEYRSTWRNSIADEFNPQFENQLTRREKGLNHLNICFYLGNQDQARKDNNVNVKKLDLVKRNLDALRAKYPNVVKRPR